MNIKSLRIIFVSILLLSISSCEEEKINLNKLMGEWKVTMYNADFKGLNPTLVNEAKKIALSGTYIFQKGGLCLYKSKYDDDRGNWSFQESKNQIKINLSNESQQYRKEKYEIVKFNVNKMTWKSSSKLGTEEITLTKK